MSRVKLDYTTGNGLRYKEYLKNCKDLGKTPVDFTVFKKIIETYTDDFLTYIIETGKALVIPGGLGALGVFKSKKKISTPGNKSTSYIDWGKTNKAGKIIRALNYHTDGYHLAWYWDNSKAVIKDRKFWKVTPLRSMKLRIPNFIKNNPNNWHHFLELKK